MSEKVTNSRIYDKFSRCAGLTVKKCYSNFVGFIKDFSGTAQICLGFSARRSGLGMSFSAGRGDPARGRPGMRFY